MFTGVLSAAIDHEFHSTNLFFSMRKFSNFSL